MTGASWVEEECVESISVSNKPRINYNKPQDGAEVWRRCKQAEDEDGGRAALKCGQLWGGRHPNSPLSLGAGFPFPVLLWECLSQQLWASYITSGFPFSLLKMRLPLFCLCSSAGRTVTVFKVLQRATNHYVRFTLEMRGLAPKTHLLSYYRSCESWNRYFAVCRAGIQVGP